MKLLSCLACLLVLSALSGVSFGQPCKVQEFACSSTAGDCVPTSWRCDGAVDCTTGADEVGCDCLSSQFRCNPGAVPAVCLSGLRRCDGSKDCPNGVDEQNCLCDNTTTHFQCTGRNQECIPRRWRCDMEPDCDDGSDEVGCVYPTGTTAATPSCRPGEILCKDKSKCIPTQWDCDGHIDCEDRSDEDLCPDLPEIQGCPNPAWMNCDNNKQCFPALFFCDNETDCVDRSDESDARCGGTLRPPIQFSAPVPECATGNLADCDGPPSYLLFSTTQELRFLELSNNRRPIYSELLSGAMDIVPLAYVHNDSGSSRIFYADNRPGSAVFNSATLQFDPSGASTAVPKRFINISVDQPIPQGLAVDWIAKNIYWTARDSKGVATLEVARLDGTYHQVILVLTGNIFPGQIVVDPTDGLLFWTERFANHRVMRIDTLGTNNMTVAPVSGAQLGSPTALTIDTASKVLYIFDHSSDDLQRISYDGVQRSAVTRTKLSNIRSLAFFSGFLYATQAGQTSFRDGRILRINVSDASAHNPRPVPVGPKIADPQTLRIVFRDSQPADASNPCSANNGGCAGLCFASGSTAACSCNGNLLNQFVAADGRSCVAGPAIVLNETSPVTVREGGTLHLTCSVALSPYLHVRSIEWRLGTGLLTPTLHNGRPVGKYYVSELNAVNLASGGDYTCELVYSLNVRPGDVTKVGPRSVAQSQTIRVQVTPGEKEPSDNTGLIVGVVCGVVVVAIIVAMVIIVVMRRRSIGSSTALFSNPGAGRNVDDGVAIVRTTSSASSKSAEAAGESV